MKPGSWGMAVVLATMLLTAASAVAQPGRGRGPMGKWSGGDPAFAADRELFHQHLRNRAAIRREVKKSEHGVETLTESDDPEVTVLIQKHVASMKKRVEDGNPIHRRDPLFAEVFRHADKITIVYEKTEKGIRVTEASDDPYAVKLIQMHADVVSLFINCGFDEVHRNHELPSKPKGASP